jgi:hypothetical protein
VDERLAASLLAARFPVPATLERTPAEFAALATIPALLTLAAAEARGVSGYALIGKGWDMAGVIHEWGAPSPAGLLQAARAGMMAAALEEMMVLAPGTLPKPWFRELAGIAAAVEEHPVGLVWSPDGVPPEFAEAFIWGLDSI